MRYLVGAFIISMSVCGRALAARSHELSSGLLAKLADPDVSAARGGICGDWAHKDFVVRSPSFYCLTDKGGRKTVTNNVQALCREHFIGVKRTLEKIAPRERACMSSCTETFSTLCLNPQESITARICTNVAERSRHLSEIKDAFPLLMSPVKLSSPGPVPELEMNKAMLETTYKAAAHGSDLQLATKFLLKDEELFALLDIQSVKSKGVPNGAFEMADLKSMISDLKQCSRAARPGGHAGDDSGAYDIYFYNCHTAANRFCYSGPTNLKRGVVKCNGDPENANQPRWHTFNWSVEPAAKETCFYNWGDKCCFSDGKTPPEYKGSKCESFVTASCMEQDTYPGPGIQVMAEGAPVELPGGAACVREIEAGSVFVKHLKPQERCSSCCQRRASIPWQDDLPGMNWRNHKSWVDQCETTCNGFFR